MPLAVVLRQEQFLLATDRPILRADEVLALQEAADVLRYAHEEARRLREQAQADGRELEAQLREAANDEVERRVAEAVAEVQVQAAALLVDVQQVAAQAVVEAVSRLAVGLDRTALFQKALDEISTMIDGRHLAVLRVCEADAPAVAEAVARMVRAARLPATLSVRADSAVKPGDCILQSSAGRHRFGVTPLVTALATSMQAWLQRAAAERRADVSAAGAAQGEAVGEAEAIT